MGRVKEYVKRADFYYSTIWSKRRIEVLLLMDVCDYALNENHLWNTELYSKCYDNFIRKHNSVSFIKFECIKCWSGNKGLKWSNFLDECQC